MKTRHTQETGLEVENQNGIWRHIDTNDGMRSAIGPHYQSKAEILADLDRYADAYMGRERGTALEALYSALNIEGAVLQYAEGFDQNYHFDKIRAAIKQLGG